MAHEENHAAHEHLTPGRLEAFSDGVMAIIITIAVLEFKLPTSAELSALAPLIPLFGAYAISFHTVGTYWNNHHILLRTTRHISTDIMWANLHFLFWLSFIPFATLWVGESHNEAWPTAFYAAILFMAGIAYTILQYSVIRHSDQRTAILATLTKSIKGISSLTCYALAIAAAFIDPVISDVLIFVVALLWFVPDRRIAQFIS